MHIIMSDKTDNKIYHECQRLGWCAKHALNGLVQRKHFTRGALDKIAENMHRERSDAYWNPHRSIIPGYGTWDVNIIIEALKEVRLRVHWFDKRRNLSSAVAWDQVQGIIVNVRGNGAISFSNHWFCIKEINGIYYNLDSKFSKPRQFTDTPEAQEYLNKCVNKLGGNLLLVTDADVDNLYIEEPS